jgi:lycopene cyclase domain-containing protein
MRHFHYALVLIFILACAFGVNLSFRLKILRQWRTFLLTDLVIVLIYGAWDIWAIDKHNWYFDRAQIVDFDLFKRLPVEELLFFILVPLMVVITYRALLKLTGWEYGADSQ